MRPSTTQCEPNLLEGWMMITVNKKNSENETDFTTLVKQSKHVNFIIYT